MFVLEVVIRDFIGEFKVRGRKGEGVKVSCILFVNYNLLFCEDQLKHLRCVDLH